MINDRDTVAMGSRAQKSEAPATVQPVTRAKYTKTKSILKHAKIALLAIFLSPTYQITIAGAATVGIILMGGRA